MTQPNSVFIFPLKNLLRYILFFKTKHQLFECTQLLPFLAAHELPNTQHNHHHKLLTPSISLPKKAELGIGARYFYLQRPQQLNLTILHIFMHKGHQNLKGTSQGTVHSLLSQIASDVPQEALMSYSYLN